MLGTLRILARLGCTALVLGALFGAGEARSAALPFTATLRIQFAGGAFTAPITGSGTAIVNGSGGGVHVTALALDAGFVSTAGAVTPVTDPGAAPIEGLQITVANGAGAFAETAMGAFGGVMPLLGVAKVCLFEPCAGAIANMSVPLSVVGVGGVAYVSAAVGLTVTGAAWTTGTVTPVPTFPQVTGMGFRRGPGSAASSTGQASGAIQLVTPIVIRTNFGLFPTPSIGILTLHFVPEPVTATLLCGGIAALAIAARRRPRA